MRISVVVATYNGALYLRKQLDSIMNQTIVPNEVIVSDDNSSDDTNKILNEYEKRYPEYITVLNNDINIGYIKNFWLAISKATGDFIFLSDQDDIWYPTKVETMVEIMKKNNNILALSASYELIDKNDMVYKDCRNVHFKNNKSIKKISWEQFLIHPKYPGMSMVIRNELLKYIPFERMRENNYYPPHDWMLNQSAAANNGLYFVDKVLTQYRQHDNNVVGSSAKSNSSNSRKWRSDLIENMNNWHKGLSHVVLNSQKIFIDKLIYVGTKREQYIKRRQLVRLVVFELFNLKYTTFRSILGDVYYCIKK